MGLRLSRLLSIVDSFHFSLHGTYAKRFVSIPSWYTSFSSMISSADALHLACQRGQFCPVPTSIRVFGALRSSAPWVGVGAGLGFGLGSERKGRGFYYFYRNKIHLVPGTCKHLSTVRTQFIKSGKPLISFGLRSQRDHNG
jgi:hypothetical protein